MIHYHGTPLTPRAKLLELAGCCFCVPFPEPRDLVVCHEIGQSVMLDNGAYTIWKQGGTLDAIGYVEWVAPWLDYKTTWCVIPDVIDGTAEDNDQLLAWWMDNTNFDRQQCAPVWHLHEHISRLENLCHWWPRVCIGSSGQYAKVGDPFWHTRMSEVMDVLCGNGPAPCWLHMLRGMSLAGTRYPFASVDSTVLAQNHAGNNTRMSPPQDLRSRAREFDGRQCASRWRRTHRQERLV